MKLQLEIAPVRPAGFIILNCSIQMQEKAN